LAYVWENPWLAFGYCFYQLRKTGSGDREKKLLRSCPRSRRMYAARKTRFSTAMDQYCSGQIRHHMRFPVFTTTFIVVKAFTFAGPGCDSQTGRVSYPRFVTTTPYRRLPSVRLQSGARSAQQWEREACLSSARESMPSAKRVPTLAHQREFDVASFAR